MKSFKFTKHIFSFLILIILLTITFLGAKQSKKESDINDQKELQIICNDIRNKIYTRLQTQAHFLRSGSALFAASDTVTAEDWNFFYKETQIEKDLPGVLGIGYAHIIKPQNIKKHIQHFQKIGFTDYTIKPKEKRDFYTAIIYIEPFSGRNLRAFGYDMFTEKNRRKAMEISRDSNIAIISGKIKLVQETSIDIQPGTLMIVPVYKKNAEISTVEERRNAIIGWVYSPYRMYDLINGIINNKDILNKNEILLQIYDGEEISPQNLLYESNQKKKPTTKQLILPIDFNGNKWTLVFNQHEIQKSILENKFLIILILGIIISVLFFILFYIIINIQKRANYIAEKLTLDLKESEERWKFALEGAGNGVWDWNIITNNLFCSSQWQEMLGVTENEFTGKLEEWSSRVHPDDLPKCFEEIQKHLQGKKNKYSSIYRIQHADGIYKWVLDRGKIIEFTNNGNPKRMIGIITDITDRILMEESLRESEAKSKAILRTLPDMMFIQNTEGIYIDCYIPEYADIYSSPDNFLGKNMADILPQNVVDEFLPIFNKAIETKQIQLFEYTLPINNKQRYFEARIICYNDDKVLSIVRDISDKKDSEDLLIQTQTNYETFFNSIDDFLFVLDLQGNIIHTNSTVTSRLGYSNEELLGISVLQVHPKNRREEAGRIVQEMLEGKVDYCPVPLETKDKRLIPVETRVTLGIWNGEQVLFGVTKDISQIKLSEEKFSKLFFMNPSACGLSELDSGMFVEVNNEFYKLFGFNKTEVLGKTVIELGILTKEAREKILYEADENGSVYNIETDLNTKFGENKHVLISAENFYVQDKKYRFTVVHDMTEQKNAEKALKKSEIHLLIALNMAKLGHWEYNVNEDLFYFNDAFYNIFHDSINSIGRYTLSSKQYAERFVYPDDLSIVENEITEAIETNNADYNRYFEHKFLYANGEIGFLAVRFQIEKDEFNKTIRLYGVNQDITEIKKTEELIKIRESYLSAIIENQPGLLWLKDKNNKFLAVNKAFATSCGQNSSENIVGKTDWDIWPKDLAEQYIADDLKVMNAGKMVIVEEEIADKGQRKWFETFKTPIFDKNGEIIGTTGFSRDITERKENENKIKEVNARLSLATHAGGVGVWDYDIVNNILVWDEQMYALYGITKETFSGAYDAWIQGLHPEDVERGNNEIQMAIRGEKEFDTEFRVCWPNGSIHNIRAVAIVQRDNNGKALRLIGTNWDITEQKNNEAALLKAKEEADIANKAKSEFLANMSHEIRTPMNAILGFSEALYHKLDSVHHQKMIKSILNSGNLLMSLLNDILDLSKIEAGKMDIYMHPVDLRFITQELLLLFQDKVKSKGIELQCSIDDTFPNSVIIDEIRIKQILFNLVGNAIKFTHSGYVNITLTFTKKTGKIGKMEIIIEDTGIGIPESEFDLIFESFQQRHGQSNRKYGGTGLGLAITKRLIEKMKGSISLTSKVNKGSTFIVTFPEIKISNESLPKNQENEDTENISFSKASILIVDDVASNIEAVENLLSGTNITVLRSYNGEQAIEILKNTTPDLILLDIRMPGIDGYETAKIIKNNSSKKHIPIIVYTASVLSANKIEHHKNFDGQLYKPVKRKDLYAVLSKFLHYTTENKVSVIEESNTLNFNNISESLQSKLPEILHILETTYIPKWETIKDSLVLFKIEEFSHELQLVGEKYSFDLIIHYAKQIKENVDMVELDTIKHTLYLFPEIISKIHELLKQ